MMRLTIERRYQNWVKVAVFNFIVAAVMGLLLRVAFVWEINWIDYRKMLHGHSHTAMLGWIYLALYALLIHAFVPKEKQSSPFYSRLFVLTQLSVIGMMISFPLQGYDTFSIIFSTSHMLLSYIFVWRLWKDSRAAKGKSVTVMRISLVSLLVSTIGLWAMPVIMSSDPSQSAWYYIVIQFYLHFQFNAWFILAVVALLIKHFIDDRNQNIPDNLFRQFIGFYLPAVVLTFFNVLTWAYGQKYSYILNGVGVVLQLAAIGILFQLLFGKVKQAVQGKTGRALIYFALYALLFKAFTQLMLIVPEWAKISTEIRNFLVGYIHLINLGIMSSALFFLLKDQLKAMPLKWEMGVFIFGILGTEIYLFLQGFFYWQVWGRLPHYHLVLFLLTVPLLFSLTVLLLRIMKGKKAVNNL